MYLVIGFIIGGFIGFFIAALLAANKEVSYTEDFLLNELYSFENYWMQELVDNYDKNLVKNVIEDFILGLMNGFERK